VGLPQRCHQIRIQGHDVEYLGHIDEYSGIRGDHYKVVRVWQAPKNASETRPFLGLATYYFRFASNFAALAFPLTHLVRQGVRFEWGEAAQVTFAEIKEAHCPAPVLRYPDDQHRFEVTTGASEFAVGAILSQDIYPAEYYVCKLPPAERNYVAHDRESPLVTRRHYIHGTVRKCFRDHRTLAHFLKQSHVSPRQTRWQNTVSEFHVGVIYREGPNSPHVDALSRRPDVQVKSKSVSGPGALSVELVGDSWLRVRPYLIKPPQSATNEFSAAHNLPTVLESFCHTDPRTKVRFDKSPENILMMNISS
jgi:hypothetical protein